MDEKQLQQEFIQFLAQQTGAKSQEELQQKIQQLGQDGLKQAYAAFLKQYHPELLQQAQSARFGAKLNYIKSLRGICPDGQTAQYYKSGGRLCKRCVAKQKKSEDPIEAFKCGQKMKRRGK